MEEEIESEGFCCELGTWEAPGSETCGGFVCSGNALSSTSSMGSLEDIARVEINEMGYQVSSQRSEEFNVS